MGHHISTDKGANGIGGKWSTVDIHHENGTASTVSVTITRDGRLEVAVMPGSQVTDWVIDVDDKAVALVEDGIREV